MTSRRSQTDPPRVLVVVLSTRFGGSDARVLGIASQLPRDRVALAVLCDAPVRSAAEDRGIRTHVVAVRKSDPRIVPRLARLIRAGGYDVVDTQNPQSRLWGSLAARLTGAALVSTLNSWYESEHEGRPKGRAYQALERFAPRPELFIAVAPEIRDRLLAQGIAADRIALIPNAVDAAPPGHAQDRVAARREAGIPADAPLVVAVGRLVEAKGYDVLIDAAAVLAPSFPELRVLIVGEGHLRPRLEEQVARLGLRDRVLLPGFRDPAGVGALVRAGDVFAMPSRTEGTPLALLEAAAAERAIVASDVGGIPSLVTDAGEAVLVPPGDPRVLAGAIAGLLRDPERAKRLGGAAGRRVVRELGRKRQVEDTVRAYGRAVERRGRRGTRNPAPG